MNSDDKLSLSLDIWAESADKPTYSDDKTYEVNAFYRAPPYNMLSSKEDDSNLIESSRINKKESITNLSQMSYEEKLSLMDVYDPDWSIETLLDIFIGNPTEFEHFCGQLFVRMGYDVHHTPPVKDGGYDLKLFHDGKAYLVECKCFSKKNHITRPLLQKLAGVNQTEGADYLIFITTSSFTKNAQIYAKQIGMQLIDGRKIERIIRHYIGNNW